MKESETSVVIDWQRHDDTAKFLARKQTQDGKFNLWNVVFELSLHLSLGYPIDKYLGKATLHYDIVRRTPTEIATIHSILDALSRKHLTSGDRRNKKPNPGQIARELVIDIIVNEPNWKPYAEVFKAFAVKNDRDFFEQVARGNLTKRNRPFNPSEVFSLMNWHSWYACPTFEALPVQPAPLKFWTAEAAAELVRLGATNSGIQPKHDVSGLRSMWRRLGLKQVTPAKVKRFRLMIGESERYKLEMNC